MTTCRDIIKEKWRENSFGFEDQNKFDIKVIAISSSSFKGHIKLKYTFEVIPEANKQSYSLLTRYVPKGIKLVSAEVIEKPQSDDEYYFMEDLSNDYLAELVYNGVVNALKSASQRNFESLNKWGYCEYFYTYAYILNGMVEKMAMNLQLYPEYFIPSFSYSEKEWEEFITGEA